MLRPATRLGAVLLLASLAVAAAWGAERDKFSLAVLRRDGVIIPFASFDGKAWSLQWPNSDVGVPLPISRGDIPKKWWGPQGPDVPWQARLLSGESRPLVLGQPVQAKVFCSGHPAIATDYRGGLIDPREPTIPKDGLAIAGDVPIRDIVNVSVHSADAKRAIDIITDEFNKEEGLAVDHFMNWRHPFSPDERAAFAIELEAFYRTTDTTSKGTWRTTYVEAIRRFPTQAGDRGCGLITFGRGWITEREGREPVINIGARVTYCDREDVSFMLPFGRVTLNNEVYWIYQLSSWRNEFYTVARVRPEEVRPVVAVAGGECPKDSIR